ncbi:MAG: PAS domain-containing protein [Phyllobacteriaceae bacterium]|nr:PAS domain-containing protein [Phyllobacteriaceae bacterium]
MWDLRLDEHWSEPDHPFRYSSEFRRLLGFVDERDFPDLMVSWIGGLHPEDVERVVAAFDAARRDRTDATRYDVCFRSRCRDGVFRWFRSTCGFARDRSGEASRACGTLIDVHAQMEAAIAAEARARIADRFRTAASDLAGSLAHSSEEVRQLARAVKAAAENASRCAQEDVTAATRTTSEVETVAAATEELTASVTEISRRIDEAAQISTDASRRMVEARDLVDGLAAAVGRIGDVVNLIKAIAGQTNLLALNATIEAARAGSAGKGFAVVAVEVKTLAAQTARATEEIADNISAVQAETARTVRAIGDVGTITERVRAISAEIAGAVEEQAAATREIGRSIVEAAAEARSVTQNAELVALSNATVESSAEEMLDHSNGMTVVAEEMRALVFEFVEKL